MTRREIQQGLFSYRAGSAPAFQALAVPRVIILCLRPSREEGETLKLCSCDHCDLEERNKKGRGGKGRERKRRKLLTNNNNHTTKITLQPPPGLTSRLENLGQRTGDLPPRTGADYSTLRFLERKLGGGEAGLLGSANEDCSAQLASSLSNRDFCSRPGDAV